MLAVQALPIRADVATSLRPVADTSLLESNPNNNLGGLADCPAGRTMAARARALFQFGLAGVPTNANILSAPLTLTSSFALNRMLRSWGEGGGVTNNFGDPARTNEATWNNRFHPSIPWGSGGGASNTDYLAAFSATNFVDAPGNYTFNSTTELVADVQAWLNHPATNFGWILISQNELTPFTVRRFASREAATNSPILALHYTVPAVPPPISEAALVGNQFHFCFPAESNRTYAVEVQSSLANGGWSTLTNIPAQLVPTTILVFDSVSNTNRFYRVRTP